jgi:hypothetical protein
MVRYQIGFRCDKLLIINSAFFKYLGGEKKKEGRAIPHLFMDFKKAHDSVTEALYNILMSVAFL